MTASSELLSEPYFHFAYPLRRDRMLALQRRKTAIVQAGLAGGGKKESTTEADFNVGLLPFASKSC